MDNGTPYLHIDICNAAGRHLVRLDGELDLASASGVEGALVEVTGSMVVVDLENLTLLDASGLTALLRAKQAIEQQGDRLVVRNAHGLVARVLEITGLDAHLLGDEPGDPSVA